MPATATSTSSTLAKRRVTAGRLTPARRATLSRLSRCRPSSSSSSTHASTIARSIVVLNRAKLRIDGDVVDSASVVYGEKELRTALPGGGEVLVTIDSGMAGELRRAQLQAPDGSWVDMEERQPRS